MPDFGAISDLLGNVGDSFGLISDFAGSLQNPFGEGKFAGSIEDAIGGTE